MSSDRILPNSRETELALVSAAMFDSAKTLLEASSVPVEAFYHHGTGLLWGAVLKCYTAGKECSLPLLLEAVAAESRAEAERALMDAMDPKHTGIPSCAADYAGIIMDRWHRRKLVAAAHHLNAGAFDLSVAPDSLVAGLSQTINGIATSSKGPRHLAEYVGPAMQQLEKCIESGSKLAGISTGIEQLDFYTHGLQAPDFWVIAARPSLGKTSLAASIAINVAKAGHNVCIFSLEQSGCALTKRMIAAEASANVRKLRGNVDAPGRIASAAAGMVKLPIWIDERAALTATQIRAEARRLSNIKGLDLVVIDYLQIFGSRDRRMDRYEMLTESSGEMKQLAKELNVPVIVLSQLSRNTAKEKRRPRLDDLRETGAIEQDADVVILLSADVEETDLPDVWRGRVPHIDKVVVADVAKNREGDTGWAFVEFNKEFTRYNDIKLQRVIDPQDMPQRRGQGGSYGY